MNYLRIFRQSVPVPLLLLALLEYGALVLSVYVAHFLRFAPGLGPQTLLDSLRLFDFSSVGLRAHIFALVNLVCLVAIGAYGLRNKEGLLGTVLRVLVGIFLVGTAALSTLFFLFPEVGIFFGRGVLAIAAWTSLLLIALLRAGFRQLGRLDSMKWRVMIVGTGHKAKRVATLVSSSEVKLVGFYPVKGENHLVDQESMLPMDGIQATAQALNVQELVVAVDERRRSESGVYPLNELLVCKLTGIRVSEDLSFLERETGRLDIRSLSSGWLVFSDGFSYSPVRDSLERSFDIVASFLLLLVTWPLMLLAVVAIKLEDGVRAPLVYSQERVGYGGRIFRLHKLRSMGVDAEKDGKARWAEKKDARVTRVGSFIRKTRIDELPQIFNVLRGEMSFVGPRPERPEFVEELAEKIPYFKERHWMKPGITGWAQISYPYGASIRDAEEKLKYDLYYIKNHNLFFDLFILVRTVEIILFGGGVR